MIRWLPAKRPIFVNLLDRISDPIPGRDRKQTMTLSSLESHQLPHRSILSRSVLKRSPCPLLLLPHQDPPRKPQCQHSRCIQTQLTLCMQMRRRFRRVDLRPFLHKVHLYHQQPGKERSRGIHGREMCQGRMRHRSRGIKTTLTGIKSWREN